jgi:hypothetical protein
MPKAWTDKDERMYKHVRDSEKKRGKSSDRARELQIAGRSSMTKAQLVQAIRRHN